ncbi:MAG: homoserine O-acetyltransferase [Methanospirillum sp.]|uniref:homoserine O-acetyltransferase MetX n=1 Tax=Methanospirillum sp. TaxID=45200 RepID=UPI00237411E6|nr:homoserine O-acetyltransferase [Methanospirillum sp.]MDD1729336.1 homoserine O-acetyltransferase [Methanospirillum sp.]
MIRGSIGKVIPKQAQFTEPLTLESGEVLPEFTVAYETYGTLDKDASNAILVCHALTGDAHAAGYHEGDEKPGWWEMVIGPGKAFDTDQYFIICSNVLGGCKGTTGPSSLHPDTGKPYGRSFPIFTISDMVRVQHHLLNYLGISRLFAVAGGSMGGMQALQWSVTYPDLVSRVIVIASTAYSTPQQIAFNEVGRSAILSDPDWMKGEYYDRTPPVHGLSLARMIGHITYLSDESMHHKFGRYLQGKNELGFDFSTDFQVESYLHHQGDQFVKRFDANSYLYITKAVDYFDLTVNQSLADAFRDVQAQFLIVSISSDWLYPPYLSQEIVSALTSLNIDVDYCEIRSNYGHDAFLLESGQMNYLLGRFLSHLTIQDLMITNVPTVSESVTIKGAAALMIAESVNHLPIVAADGRLCGIVTSWDISRSVAQEYRSLEDIMSREVITASPGELVSDAVKRMEQHHISALPVLDEERRVVGLITAERLSRLVSRCR